MSSWLRLHRSVMHSTVANNLEVFYVWIWILCNVSFKESHILVGKQEVSLMPGELVFGRKAVAKELKFSESKLYRIVKLLERMGNIVIKPNNKFSVISVVNWGKYQGCDYESEQQMNIKRTSSEQQMNTINNVKNVKNYNNAFIKSRIPTPKATKFSNFENHSGIDYKKLEMEALKKRMERCKNND